MKITLEGTPDEIAQWAQRVAGVTNVVNAPCLLPHYLPSPAQVYPMPSWPWDGPVYTVPGTTITITAAEVTS